MTFFLKSSVLAFLLLLLLLNGVAVVESFPDGAGACPRSQAAVAGPHLAGNVVNGTLAQGNLTLFVFNQDVRPPTSGISFVLGTEYTIGVRRDGGGSFRGVLLRAEDRSRNPIGSFVLEPEEGEDLLHDASVCEAPAVGVTHNSRVDKKSVSARIRYDVPDDATASNVFDATLDVTVVIAVENGRSEYYYTKYFMNFLNSLPTEVPARPPPAPATSPPSPNTSPPSPNTLPPNPNTLPPNPNTSPPTTRPPSPTDLPAADDQCLYKGCETDEDCCTTAPICRLRSIGGSTQRVCSARTRISKTKLCADCGGSGGRHAKGM